MHHLVEPQGGRASACTTGCRGKAARPGRMPTAPFAPLGASRALPHWGLPTRTCLDQPQRLPCSGPSFRRFIPASTSHIRSASCITNMDVAFFASIAETVQLTIIFPVTLEKCCNHHFSERRRVTIIIYAWSPGASTVLPRGSLSIYCCSEACSGSGLRILRVELNLSSIARVPRRRPSTPLANDVTT